MSKFKTITALLAPGAFAEVVAEDTYRRFLQIQNKGTDSIYLNFGTATPDQLNSIEIPSGGFYEPWKCPSNALVMSADSTASGNVPVLIVTDESSATTVRS